MTALMCSRNCILRCKLQLTICAPLSRQVGEGLFVLSAALPLHLACRLCLLGYTIAQALEGLGPAAARSPPSLEECVDQDPYLSIYFAGEVQHIKLDIEQLLQDAAAAAVAVVIPPQLQDRQQLSGAAAAAGSSILQQVGPTFSDAAAAGASSSRRSDGWPAVNGANSSTAHAAAAARGAQEVSVSALLQHVGSRVWHSSNLQLDLARRILAEHLVTKANEGVEPHCPAHSDAEAYREDFSKSGEPSIGFVKLGVTACHAGWLAWQKCSINVYV